MVEGRKGPDLSNPVVHWEIGASDAAGLRAFYRELFDWQITPAGPEYSLVEGVDVGIGGGILQLTEQLPSYLTFYVQVEQLESTLQRAVALGARQVVTPTAIPGIGRFALFEDPEGHLIGLLESVEDS